MPTGKRQGKRLQGQKVILRDKRYTDAANDYAWGADSELMYLDAAEPFQITFAEFSAAYIDEINHQNKRHRRFAIETLDGKHIGNCTYYNIDSSRKEVELGIMIGDREYWGKGYGSDAVVTLVHHIFHDVGMQRICLHTLEWNVRAQRCFEKCGFVPCGRIVKRGYRFAMMELFRDWLKPASEPLDSER
jgi:RimJ/RimL family protein N-acetyltransferase